MTRARWMRPAARPGSTPFYADATVTLHHGHALDVLRTLPTGSVDCVVTSPPYFGLRDYGAAGQIGAERTLAEFVTALRDVFREVARVLTVDGTCWLNLGDSYSTNLGQGSAGPKTTLQGGGRPSFREDRAAVPARRTARAVGEVPRKNMLGAPWRVAFALQDDGWIVRNDIIWHKPNAMPESVTDRLAGRYEHLFLMTRSRRYHFALDAIREQPVTNRVEALTWARGEQGVPGQKPQHRPTRPDTAVRGRNPGDVWTMATVPFTGAHFAAYPPELVRRCLLAGARPGGTVLDPFHGSGTTGMVAQQLGHRYIGIDLSREYLELSLRTRLAAAALDFGA